MVHEKICQKYLLNNLIISILKEKIFKLIDRYLRLILIFVKGNLNYS